MRNKFLLALLLTLSFNVFAAKIAVIDSGTDYQHKHIIPYQWTNSGETLNGQDSDGNGFVDDFYGWNFAENNKDVIDYQYLGTFSDDVYKFFEIQLKSFLGTITEEEKEWIRQKRQDQQFIQELSTFGNFMHGTHVTGIAVNESQENMAMAIKLLPTKVNVQESEQMFEDYMEGMRRGLFGEFLIRYLLTQAAQRQMQLLTDVAKYVHAQGMEVANGSFGVSYARAKDLVKQIWQSMMNEECTEEKAHELAIFFLDENLKFGKDFVGAAPDTLFVFAAGNDGDNNDVHPSSPTNIKEDNVISVAATLGFRMLAPFSNYGIRMVEVAAPGVGIMSSIPTPSHDEYMAVSGTSQAAPYVANLAGEIKTINGKLRPIDVKQILMETVDKKDFLAGVVKSGGIVNINRAKYAARLSADMDVASAIQNSLMNVKDMEDTYYKAMGEDALDLMYVLPLPTMYQW